MSVAKSGSHSEAESDGAQSPVIRSGPTSGKGLRLTSATTGPFEQPGGPRLPRWLRSYRTSHILLCAQHLYCAVSDNRLVGSMPGRQCLGSVA